MATWVPNASIPNMTLAIDNERDYIAGDIVADPFVVANGHLDVPVRPGLGVDIDLDQIRHYEVPDIKGAYLDPRRPGWFPVKPAY